MSYWTFYFWTATNHTTISIIKHSHIHLFLIRCKTCKKQCDILQKCPHMRTWVVFETCSCLDGIWTLSSEEWKKIFLMFCPLTLFALPSLPMLNEGIHQEHMDRMNTDGVTFRCLQAQVGLTLYLSSKCEWLLRDSSCFKTHWSCSYQENPLISILIL